MNTTHTSLRVKGFAIGTHVTLAPELSSAANAIHFNVIHEVVDARLANGGYVYTVAPVTDIGADRAHDLKVLRDDLKEVR